MSRLTTMSPAAIKAMFSPESNETLIALFTLKNNPASGLMEDIRICDTYLQRLSENDEDVIYGVESNGIPYVYVPVEIILPNEDSANAPRATISISDVTRYALPALRGLTGSIDISLELVLSSSPDTVEVAFTGLKLTNITYNKSTINGELTVPSLEIEPFPVHSFTPSYFPGLF